MSKRCGAIAKHGRGRCMLWAGPTGRCRFHRGRPGKGIPRWPQKRPREHMEAAWAARRLRQAERKAMGLPWFGGITYKNKPPESETDRTKRTMAEAIEIADRAIAVLQSGNSEATLLQEGITAALTLNRDTVKLTQTLLERDGENVDQKMLRLGNETAMSLCRLGMRVAENQFKAKKDDVLAKLLESLARDDKAK